MYKNEYFENRNKNDIKRLESFELEKKWMQKFVSFDGVICDVGCSTGEFLDCVNWEGDRYGMEINESAIELAKTRRIQFSDNILNKISFFDCVVFRGTIQHIPSPFDYIKKAFQSLKKNGMIFFIATPNANSIVYKIKNTLPALDPKLNYYIPSDLTLSSILKNEGFEVLDIKYPYKNSPYCSFISDHVKFCKSLFFSSRPDYAFWGNMMNIAARKT